MKKRILGLGVLMFGLTWLSTGCYYDKEEVLYPPGVCDTAVVKYSEQITYIISNKCYDCHSNATAPLSGSNESWEGYANLSGYLAAGFGTTTFINSINHEAGYTPMPKDRPKLSPCDIRTIEIWIENGYPNN